MLNLFACCFCCFSAGVVFGSLDAIPGPSGLWLLGVVCLLLAAVNAYIVEEEIRK
jgi:hypothetical protein